MARSRRNGKRCCGLERLKASGKGGEWCRTAAKAIKLQLGSQGDRSRLRRVEGCLDMSLDFHLVKLLVYVEAEGNHYFEKDETK